MFYGVNLHNVDRGFDYVDEETKEAKRAIWAMTGATCKVQMWGTDVDSNGNYTPVDPLLQYNVERWALAYLKGIFNPLLTPTVITDFTKHLNDLRGVYKTYIRNQLQQFKFLQGIQAELAPVFDARVAMILRGHSKPFEAWMGNEKLYADTTEWEKAISDWCRRQHVAKADL